MSEDRAALSKGKRIETNTLIRDLFPTDSHVRTDDPSPWPVLKCVSSVSNLPLVPNDPAPVIDTTGASQHPPSSRARD